MKLTRATIIFVGAALVCLFAVQVPVVKADNVDYSYTGANNFAETSFDYLNLGGYLSDTAFTEVVPTTASDLFFDGTDYGQITAVDFLPMTYDVIGVQTGSSYLGVDEQGSYDVGTAGTYALTAYGNYSGALVVTDEPSTTVPEPGSLSLLLVGIGFVLVIRKRIAQTIPQAD